MTRPERDRISKAIASAENGTSGQIAVRVIPDRAVDAFERATSEFARIGLHRRERQNAALVLIAPNARRFAVIGDRALHARVGDAFWNDVIEQTQPYFARGAIADGAVHAVTRIGEAMREHFASEDGEA